MSKKNIKVINLDLVTMSLKEKKRFILKDQEKEIKEVKNCIRLNYIELRKQGLKLKN